MNIKFHQILHFTSTGKNISLFSHASTESYFIEQQLLVSIYLPIYLCIFLSIHLSIYLNNVERCRNQCEHSSFKLKRTTFGVFRPHDLQIDTGAKSPKHLRCAKLFGEKKQTKMENPIPSQKKHDGLLHPFIFMAPSSGMFYSKCRCGKPMVPFGK